MTKLEVLQKMRELCKKDDEFINSLHATIASAFLDNPSYETQQRKCGLLTDALFGSEVEGVYWFLYEFTEDRNRKEANIVDNGKKYVIKSDKDYYKYLLKTNKEFWSN